MSPRSSLSPKTQKIIFNGLQLILGLVFGRIFQEFTEAGNCSVSIKVDNFICALLEQFDCWEALNLHLLQFVGSGVHLGDDDGLVVFVFLPQLVPDGSQLLAVSAPRGVELNWREKYY